jgi:hypothetical protein
VNLLNADQVELVNDQLDEALKNFVRDHCQVADHSVQEMYGERGDDSDSWPFVFVMMEIDGDDGVTRNWYVKIDMEDESHELLRKQDFVSEAIKLEDIADNITDLSLRHL